MFHKKTKRQKKFYKILKYTNKKYKCDGYIEKVKGKYEFNVYHPFREDIENYLKSFNIETLFVSDDDGDFIVVREGKYE